MTLVQTEPKKIYLWVEVQPITTAWVYHNEELWLISLSSDWTNWLTIADKNLWATSTDVSSENSYWNYYQRWNCYWFKKWATITTSSTKVNASSYWPSNYYSDSTFRIVQVWDTSNNSNLWWGTWTVLERKWPCDVWFHIPTRTEITGLMNIMSSLWLSLSTWASLNTYLFAPYNWYMGTSNTNVWWIWSYWYWYISEANGTDNAYSVELRPASLNYSTYSDKKWYWLTIRPFKNEAVQPREWWTKLN